MSDRSRIPDRLIWSVRGIGVAVIVSTSTVFAELLQPLFVRDAEALLFVDDHQSQVLEFEVFGQQAVRPDHDIDCPGADGVERLRLLFGRPEAREHIDLERERRHALAERVEVLRGQDRGRAKHGDLTPLRRDLERGANRDLGLAVADIAADQAVHRARGFQVALDIVDRGLLVGRLGVGERVLHLVLPRRSPRHRHDRATACRAAYNWISSPAISLACRCALAVVLTHSVPPSLLTVGGDPFGADVLLDPIDLIDRDIQFVAALVLDEQVLFFDALHGHLDQTRERRRCHGGYARHSRRP